MIVCSNIFHFFVQIPPNIYCQMAGQLSAEWSDFYVQRFFFGRVWLGAKSQGLQKWSSTLSTRHRLTQDAICVETLTSLAVLLYSQISVIESNQKSLNFRHKIESNFILQANIFWFESPSFLCTWKKMDAMDWGVDIKFFVNVQWWKLGLSSHV